MGYVPGCRQDLLRITTLRREQLGSLLVCTMIKRQERTYGWSLSESICSLFFSLSFYRFFFPLHSSWRLVSLNSAGSHLFYHLLTLTQYLLSLSASIWKKETFATAKIFLWTYITLLSVVFLTQLFHAKIFTVVCFYFLRVFSCFRGPDGFLCIIDSSGDFYTLWEQKKMKKSAPFFLSSLSRFLLRYTRKKRTPGSFGSLWFIWIFIRFSRFPNEAEESIVIFLSRFVLHRRLGTLRSAGSQWTCGLLESICRVFFSRRVLKLFERHFCYRSLKRDN